MRTYYRMMSVALIGIALAAQTTANAVTQNWIGGNGTWDDTTTGNWSGGAVPVNGDIAKIETPEVSVGYTAANLSGTGLNNFYLQHAGAGTSTFTLDDSDYLPVDLVVGVGRYVTGAATLNIMDNASLVIDGGGSGLVLGYTAGGGPHILNQSGGSITNGVTSGSLIYIYPSGTYNLSGGSYFGNRSLDLAGGTFHQTGGSVTLANGYGMTIGANSTFVFEGGTFAQSGGQMRVSSNASVTWASGVPSGNFSRLKLEEAGARWNMHGGTSTVNNFGGSSATKDSLYLFTNATLQGYGTIQDARFGASSPATFDNSGRVIANGYNVDNTFDLSRFRSVDVVNTTDNTTSNGWFAFNKGKLLLPLVGVSGGDSTVNWGEAEVDATIDLVNSVRLAFTGATAGNMTGALLAADRTDVPAGLYQPVGVWSFGGVDCTSVALTFRYDNEAASTLGFGSADLAVWRYDGANWQNVTASVDEPTKTITSQVAASLVSTTFFAVAGTEPPAGTLITIR